VRKAQLWAKAVRLSVPAGRSNLWANEMSSDGWVGKPYPHRPKVLPSRVGALSARESLRVPLSQQRGKKS